MTGKKHSRFSVIASVALAMLLLLGTALPSLAASSDPAAQTAQAAITKLLKVPVGTAIPSNLSYEFIVTSVSVDGAAPTSPSSMPVIGTKIDDTHGKININYNGAQTLEETDFTGTSLYYLESADIFNGVTWPHAGIYEFHIKETANTYTLNQTPPPTESATYSKAEYTLFVYVASIGGVDVITHIGALMIVDDEGFAISAQDQVKVDPTPGGGTGWTHKYSQMTFTNSYVKTNGGTDPEDPNDWTLSVKKEVDGTFAEPHAYFTFYMDITAPYLVSGNPQYTAYVVEEDPANLGEYLVKTTADNFAGIIEADGSFTVTSGTPFSFKLKHGQYLVFTDTHVGARYMITEGNTPGYTIKATVTYSGTPGGLETSPVGGALTIPNVTNLIYKNNIFVGEGENNVFFLNDRGTTTPTGISVDDLPYIALIVVGILALAGFVAFKFRKRTND